MKQIGKIQVQMVTKPMTSTSKLAVGSASTVPRHLSAQQEVKDPESVCFLDSCRTSKKKIASRSVDLRSEIPKNCKEPTHLLRCGKGGSFAFDIIQSTSLECILPTKG